MTAGNGFQRAFGTLLVKGRPTVLKTKADEPSIQNKPMFVYRGRGCSKGVHKSFL